MSLRASVVLLKVGYVIISAYMLGNFIMKINLTCREIHDIIINHAFDVLVNHNK